jgi:hypothetical protein
MAKYRKFRGFPDSGKSTPKPFGVRDCKVKGKVGSFLPVHFAAKGNNFPFNDLQFF